MEKFTKGEWELNKYTSNGNGATRVFAYEIWCGNKCIVYKTDIEYSCDDLKKEYLANAYLISAAPEMYEEIQRDVETLSKFVDTLKEYSDDWLFYNNELKRKRFLLAKARGE